MVKTLRTKFLLGVAPLLAITIGLGLWATVMFIRLGGNIDVILRENYRSVLAAQRMKEALERMDSALLFVVSGQEQRGVEQFHEYQAVLEKNLRFEEGNITLPHERQLADELKALFSRYLVLAERYFAMPAEENQARIRLYFSELLPTFDQIKNRADMVLEINQRNMEVMDLRARSAASSATRWMVLILLGALTLGTAIALLLSRSVLGPIREVTLAARGMASGDLEQVVPVLTHDELGELATAFNAMARTIREFRQAGTARLLRAQKTAQATINSFPDPVVVVDTSGAIERANPAARRLLQVHASDGELISWQPPSAIRAHLADVLRGEANFMPTSFEQAICLREEGQERYFLPRVLSIHDEVGNVLGAAVVLSDITRFRMLDQLKNDLVSTVSHELKTPLTGIQMAVHLLLEEIVGPLNPKQIELLLAARQDSDRLLAMVNNLLDLTRIEQGQVRLDLRAIDPSQLVADSVRHFESQAEDRGIHLAFLVEPGLPSVLVDRERVAHVFDNLIGNALEHTSAGGSIRVSAQSKNGFVQFRVEDTGEGIPPEYLSRVFEKFFRVPGSRSSGGAGLGLAICREIVTAHGGRIEVSSEPDKGATFTFTLPAAKNDPSIHTGGSTA